MDVGFGERFGVAIRAEKDRTDHSALPLDWHDDDRPHVARVEGALDAAERRIGGRVRDEHRLAGIQRALELRVAVEIDDEIANRRILIAGDETNLVLFAREEDRAPVEPEGVAELAGDGLKNVDEVEGRRDFLQDVDDRDQVVALALQLGYASAQPSDFIVPPIGLQRRRLGESLKGEWEGGRRCDRRLWVALIHLPLRDAR